MSKRARRPRLREVTGTGPVRTEGSPMTTQKIQLAIRATPDQVWNALTDGAVTPAYYLGFAAEYDLTVGAGYRYTAGGGD